MSLCCAIAVWATVFNWISSGGSPLLMSYRHLLGYIPHPSHSEKRPISSLST